MRVFVFTMIVSALWIILGAALHRRRRLSDGAAGAAWWWDAFGRHARRACRAPLPLSHPLARLTRSL